MVVVGVVIVGGGVAVNRKKLISTNGRSTGINININSSSSSININSSSSSSSSSTGVDVLSVSGQLNPERGGPGFEDVSITPNNGTTYYEAKDRDDPAVHRRTIYRFTPRGGRTALLDTFDCPDPSAAAPTRNVTTTPLQALSLLNNPFVLRMAGRMAEHITRRTGDNIDAQVTRAWQLAIQRDPDPREKRLSVDLVRQHGLATLCRGLFNINDFVIIE